MLERSFWLRHGRWGQPKADSSELSWGKVTSRDWGRRQNGEEEGNSHNTQGREPTRNGWMRMGRWGRSLKWLPGDLGGGPIFSGRDSPGTKRVGLVVLVWGDPRLEGEGLGFGSSLPVLPGARSMLRLIAACAPAPSSPPIPPSAELSPPVGRLYFLGTLAAVQGGPGWLQRQEGQGLRCASPSPLLPSLLPHPVPADPASCPQVAASRELSLTAPCSLRTLPPAPGFTLALACSLPLNSENRAPLFLATRRPQKGIHHTFTHSQAPSMSASLQGASPALSKPHIPHLKHGICSVQLT